jgi:D-threo-aldose 1-dehydrogenase
MNIGVAARGDLPDNPKRVIALPLIGRATSCIGFGTGGLLRIASARRRQDTLAAAFTCGITHFDTAPLYGFGESERALGRFLRGQRSKVTLTTKFGLQPSPLAARLAVFQGVARRALELFPGLRRTAVRNAGALATQPTFSLATARASLERSLRALRTDYVDFFLAHQASVTALPDEDLIGWLDDMKRAGKIRAFGVATDFEWLLPVLQHRPQLSHVVQFDNDLTSGNIAALGDGASRGAERLLITYGFIGRAIAVCRERLAVRGNSTAQSGRRAAGGGVGDLGSVDDDELGGLLLRAAILANPRGIVLMQSRSTVRIERNVRAATSDSEDERVRQLVNLLGSRP